MLLRAASHFFFTLLMRLSRLPPVGEPTLEGGVCGICGTAIAACEAFLCNGTGIAFGGVRALDA